jgi:hypothetical protein
MVDMGLQPQQQADVTENPTSAVHAAPRDFRVELDVFLIADTMDAATTIVAAIPSLGARNSTKVSVAAGESKVAVIMELRDVPQSALWYPNGYGNAVLHNLTVTVGEPPSASTDSVQERVLDAVRGPDPSRWSKRIGLKSVEIVQVRLTSTCSLATHFPIQV